MTRKDFELIARVISNTPMDDLTRGKLVREFVVQLSATNPRFKPNTFRAACLADIYEPSKRAPYIAACYRLEKHANKNGLELVTRDHWNIK